MEHSVYVRFDNSHIVSQVSQLPRKL